MKKVVLAAVMGAMVLSVGAEEIAVEESSAANPFTGVYLGLGIGGRFASNKYDIYDNSGVYQSSAKKNSLNRFMGTVVLGGGYTFAGKFYVGGEALVDFARSYKYRPELTVGAAHSDECTVRGIVPALALRLGYVKNDWLFYAKPLSISFSRFTEKDLNTSTEMATVSKASYAVGLGIEKAFCRKFSARLEGEYVFPTKKATTITGTAYEARTKLHKGFNLRALVAYNVKI